MSEPWFLAVDTATSRIVVAAGRPDGELIHALDWPAGHKHGERLLPGVEALLQATGLARADLAGVIVGTGPGAFTGLRVGLATAKALAHGLRLPIAGVGTGAGLLQAAASDLGREVADVALLQPAGPHDRVVTRAGEPSRLLPGGEDPVLRPTDVLVAVDLDGRVPSDALERGGRALDGLARALVGLGAAVLGAGTGDDVDRLVPEYVTLPRGASAPSGEIEWSHGPR